MSPRSGKDAISYDEEKSTWRGPGANAKSGEPVYLPIPGDLKMVLDALPLNAECSAGLPILLLETGRA